MKDDTSDEEVNNQRLLPGPSTHDPLQRIVEEGQQTEQQDHVLTRAIGETWPEEFQARHDQDDCTPPVREFFDLKS